MSTTNEHKNTDGNLNPLEESDNNKAITASASITQRKIVHTIGHTLQLALASRQWEKKKEKL